MNQREIIKKRREAEKKLIARGYEWNDYEVWESMYSTLGTLSVRKVDNHHNHTYYIAILNSDGSINIMNYGEIIHCE